MPRTGQQPPAAALRVLVPAVAVLAVGVPMPPVSRVSVRARRGGQGLPESQQRRGHITGAYRP